MGNISVRVTCVNSGGDTEFLGTLSVPKGVLGIGHAVRLYDYLKGRNRLFVIEGVGHDLGTLSFEQDMVYQESEIIVKEL